MKKFLVSLLKKLEWGSALSVRLTKLTHKAHVPTHPKHLIDLGQWYYLKSITPQDYILDLGCHAGERALTVAQKAKAVIGLDIDHKLLSQATSEANRLGITNIKFYSHDLETRLRFPSHTFTKVFLFAVLEHIDHRDQLLTEIRRVLKPRGQFFLSVPNKNSSWKKLQRQVGLNSFADLDHKLEFSKTEVVALLKANKYKNIKVKTTAVDTPLSGVIDAIGGISLTAYKRLMHWRLSQGRNHPHSSVGFLITASHG